MREELLQEAWLQQLMHNEQVTTYFVYSDPSINEPRISGSDVFLPGEERYDRLAEKTYHMLKYFNTHDNFDYLIKMDDSILSKKMGKRLRHMNLLRLCRGHYGGCDACYSVPLTTRKWLQRKNLHVNENTFPWWSGLYKGKCYFLSRKAVGIIAEHGKEYLPRFLNDFGGLEDVMVSVILHEHLLSIRDRMKIFYTAVLTQFRKIFHK